jgi:hypothetical protein
MSITRTPTPTKTDIEITEPMRSVAHTYALHSNSGAAEMGIREIGRIGNELTDAIFAGNTHLNKESAVDQQAVRTAANELLSGIVATHNEGKIPALRWNPVTVGTGASRA